MQETLKFLSCKSGTYAEGTEKVCLVKVTYLISCRGGHAAETCVKLRQVAHVPGWERRLSRRSQEDQPSNDIWNTRLQNKKPPAKIENRDHRR